MTPIELTKTEFIQRVGILVTFTADLYRGVSLIIKTWVG